jgi:hypothetical protein
MLPSAAPTRSATRATVRDRPAGLAGLGAIILALTLVPYFCGYLLAPGGSDFLGALNNMGDLSQYLAAIRQGADGAWQYTNQFTPDNARRLFIYTPYMFIGHISLGLPATVSFHVLRLLSAIALLAALARFCRLFIGPFALRGCWLFVILAGTLYWLALPLSAFVPGLVDASSLTAPELSPLITLLISPHETLGLAAELMGFYFMLRASGATEPLWAESRPRLIENNERFRHVAGAAASFLVLALSYPFLLPTVGCVLVAFAAVSARSALGGRIAAATPRRRLRAGEVFVTELRSIVLALTPAGIVGLYYLNIFHNDRLWSHSGLAQVGRPDFGVLIFAFGALVFAATQGARRLHRLRLSGGNAVPTAWAWFPLIWSATNLCTLMLPVWQQGRQALGLSVPLALLSFLWLAGPKVVSDGMRGTLPALPASALAFSSPLLLALYTAVTAAGVNKGYYVRSSVEDSISWIGDHAGADDVILSSAGFANLVPESCSCRVVVGQNFQTFNWHFRQLEVHSFYQARTTASAMRVLRQIEQREGVTMVVFSPLETAIGHIVLTHVPGYRPVYSRDAVTIFARTRAHD